MVCSSEVSPPLTYGKANWNELFFLSPLSFSQFFLTPSMSLRVLWDVPLVIFFLIELSTHLLETQLILDKCLIFVSCSPFSSSPFWDAPSSPSFHCVWFWVSYLPSCLYSRLKIPPPWSSVSQLLWGLSSWLSLLNFVRKADSFIFHVPTE